VSSPELCFVKHIYLFIHSFATSIALGQVKQVLKHKNNASSPTMLQDLHKFSYCLKIDNLALYLLNWYNIHHSFVFCIIYLEIVILQERSSCNKGNIIYSRHSSVVHYVLYSNLDICHHPVLCVIWISNHS
jgi:hypothetical protein